MTIVLVRSAWVTTYWFKLSRVIGGERRYFAIQLALGALPLLILVGGWMARPRRSGNRRATVA
jgi:hypothetical protein